MRLGKNSSRRASVRAASSQAPYRSLLRLTRKSSFTALLVLSNAKRSALCICEENGRSGYAALPALRNRESEMERVSFDVASVSRKRVHAAGRFPSDCLVPSGTEQLLLTYIILHFPCCQDKMILLKYLVRNTIIITRKKPWILPHRKKSCSRASSPPAI